MNPRSALSRLGVESRLVDLTIPYLYFLPRTSDPETQGVRLIIAAIQTGLRKLGHKSIRANGIFDLKTEAALNSISPPPGSWKVKTWIQLIYDVITAMDNPVSSYYELKALNSVASPHPQGDFWEDLKAIGSGTAFLKWGYGATNKSNCAPADNNTKSVFQGLQRQINRLSSMPIVEDGVIGANTVRAVQALSSVIGFTPTSCADIANQAVLIATKLKMAADARGVSADANKFVAVAPPVQPVGTVFRSQETFDAAKKSGVATKGLKEYLPFIAIAGFAAWAANEYRKSKKDRLVQI